MIDPEDPSAKYYTEGASGSQVSFAGAVMNASVTTSGGPGGPKRADARRNYELLITAATQAFAERGADDVSLEEIARRAGVGIGTLYRHFPARQNLLEAVYKDQVDGLQALAGKLVVAESPGAALAEWLRAFAAFGRTKRSLSAALVATIGKDSALMSECSRILRSSTEELLTRAQEAGAVRPEIQPSDLIRIVHGLIVASDSAPGDTGQADRIVGLMMGGLLTHPGS
jgi:AcrR family transcriptional regulator